MILGCTQGVDLLDVSFVREGLVQLGRGRW